MSHAHGEPPRTRYGGKSSWSAAQWRPSVASRRLVGWLVLRAETGVLPAQSDPISSKSRVGTVDKKAGFMIRHDLRLHVSPSTLGSADLERYTSLRVKQAVVMQLTLRRLQENKEMSLTLTTQVNHASAGALSFLAPPFFLACFQLLAASMVRSCSNGYQQS